MQERLIDVLCGAVVQHDAGKNPGMLERLRDELLDACAEMRRTRRRARQSKYQALDLRPDTPFIRVIIALLAASSPGLSESESSIAWLRECLERWYQALPKEQAYVVAKAFTGNGANSIEQQRRLRYAVLLHAFLQATCTLSTDVLVLVELGEAVTRQLGDGAQLLYGILSRGARLRRRTMILGPGVLGIHGARRYRKWLLPKDVAIETLKGIETLLYPELHTEEEIQKPEPWSIPGRVAGGYARLSLCCSISDFVMTPQAFATSLCAISLANTQWSEMT
jgi:hypothetical protein